MTRRRPQRIGRRYLVGLTGGLASGKSTVGRWLREAGFLVLDADRMVAELYAPGEAGAAAVRRLFGDGILRDDGAVDHPKLAQLVFNDPPARKRLEKAIHPLVSRRFQEIATNTDSIVVYEAPLLVEAGRSAEFDLVLSVETTPRLQLERAVARGMDEASARARLLAQGDGEARRLAAHRILLNEGSLEDLRSQVDELVRELRTKGV